MITQAFNFRLNYEERNRSFPFYMRVIGTYTDDKFKKSFRMNRATFETVYKYLSEIVERHRIALLSERTVITNKFYILHRRNDIKLNFHILTYITF